MDSWNKKSKWDSQRVHKIYKNRHGKMDWDYYHHRGASAPNETGRLELKSFCDNRQKNRKYFYDDQYDTEYYDVDHSIPAWVCGRCTYRNVERNGQCSICQLPFQQDMTSRKANSHIVKSAKATFGQYLQPILQQIQNKEDDMDESVQIAISLSLEDVRSNHEEIKENVQKATSIRVDVLIKGKFGPKMSKKRTSSNDFGSYWREMSEFYTFLNANFDLIARRNRNRVIVPKKAKEPKDDHNDNPQMLRGAASLLSSNNALYNAVPSLRWVRESLEKNYGAKSFYIRGIASPIVVRRFLGAGNVGKLEVVYHGTNSRNDESIISKGLVCGGTRGVAVVHGTAYGRGVYCSPNLGTASGYQSGSMFICVVRAGNVKKSGSIYVVPDDCDILPLYLASFQYSAAVTLPIIKNGMVLLAEHSFRPLNVYDRKKRAVERKWSAYHKLRKYDT